MSRVGGQRRALRRAHHTGRREMAGPPRPARSRGPMVGTPYNRSARAMSRSPSTEGFQVADDERHSTIDGEGAPVAELRHIRVSRSAYRRRGWTYGWLYRLEIDSKRTSSHASSCKRKGFSLTAVVQKSGLSHLIVRLSPQPNRAVIVLRPLLGAPLKKALP